MSKNCSDQNKTSVVNVLMETEVGSISLEIYPENASISATNFLRYVDEERYKGASFYRVVRMDNQPHNDVKIEVIQGGLGFDAEEEDNELLLPPIQHETTAKTGIPHTDGVISMARMDPGTASSEFFICINDQPELDWEGKRNPDLQGFATFGKVTSGMDVVRKIQSGEDKEQFLNQEIKILSIKRIK